jgi:hypothetical protein
MALLIAKPDVYPQEISNWGVGGGRRQPIPNPPKTHSVSHRTQQQPKQGKVNSLSPAIFNSNKVCSSLTIFFKIDEYSKISNLDSKSTILLTT